MIGSSFVVLYTRAMESNVRQCNNESDYEDENTMVFFSRNRALSWPSYIAFQMWQKQLVSTID